MSAKPGHNRDHLRDKPYPRELQILSMRAQGKSLTEIADDLDISWHTAKNHMTNLFEAVGAASAVHAYRICLAKDYIDLPDNMVAMDREVVV